MNYLNNISEVFNPTPTRVKATNRGELMLMRIKDKKGKKWTTNGCWAILTANEPKSIQKINNNDRQPKIDRVLEIQDLRKLKKMELTNTVKLIDNTPAVVLKNHKHKTVVNAYFLALLDKGIFSSKYLQYFQESENKVLIVKYDNEIIAMIMPIKTN